jgi:hypothetical protein
MALKQDFVELETQNGYGIKFKKNLPFTFGGLPPV